MFFHVILNDTICGGHVTGYPWVRVSLGYRLSFFFGIDLGAQLLGLQVFKNSA